MEISFGELTKDGHRVFTGFIRDISERKQAEETRKQAQKTIQTTQAELARVSRLTTMGELAASIAHEVNQPLTAVTNNGNACLRLLANQNLQPDVSAPGAGRNCRGWNSRQRDHRSHPGLHQEGARGKEQTGR